jgi:hypothetical protein
MRNDDKKDHGQCLEESGVPGDDKNDALVRKRKSVREKEQLAMQQPKRASLFFRDTVRS